jgi:2-methylcitrate dehydratase PrpD
MSDLTAHLAAFIANAAVPATVRAAAKPPLVDTVGVMLAGAASELAPPLTRYLDEHHRRGECIVLGTARTAPAEIAALAHGTFGHALDFDDGIVSAPVHPSSVVVAALLTEVPRLPGAALLDAYAIGVEVAVKLAVAIGIGHYHHGWHGTGTLGVLGAVAALARARALDPAITRTAFGLAASMASGVQRNFGTMTKPLHSGWAARNAVVAIELARAGFSAAQDALEADNGFFAVYGDERSEPGRVLAELGNPWALEDPGISLKRYACCYASHRPIEGLLALRRELKFSEQDVESVRCVLAPGSLRALIYPRPSNGLEGKFSLEYALAAGVIDGHYTLWTFSDEAVTRSAVRALLPRITVLEDPRCAVGDAHAATRGPSRRGFVEVQVTTGDGRRAAHRVDKVPGSPQQPLTWDEIRLKFLDCAGGAGLDPVRAASAFEQMSALEHCRDVAAIVALLRR